MKYILTRRCTWFDNSPAQITVHHYQILARCRAVQTEFTEFNRRSEFLEKLPRAALAAISTICRYGGARLSTHGGKADIIGAALQHGFKIARRKIGKDLLCNGKTVHFWFL